jgi:hypothetical protein
MHADNPLVFNLRSSAFIRGSNFFGRDAETVRLLFSEPSLKDRQWRLLELQPTNRPSYTLRSIES